MIFFTFYGSLWTESRLLPRRIKWNLPQVIKELTIIVRLVVQVSVDVGRWEPGWTAGCTAQSEYWRRPSLVLPLPSPHSCQVNTISFLFSQIDLNLRPRPRWKMAEVKCQNKQILTLLNPSICQNYIFSASSMYSSSWASDYYIASHSNFDIFLVA